MTKMSATPESRPVKNESTDKARDINKRKTVAVWLALLFGTGGFHWFYLGRSRGWAYIAYLLLATGLSLRGTDWLYLLLFGVSFFASAVDTLYLGLMPDERWNLKFAPGAPSDTRQSNGLTVTALALALGLGVTALMTMLAIVFQWYFTGTAA